MGVTRVAYSLAGVGYRIGGATILEGATFDIAYGRVLALVGPNGAGKSSLLSLLTGDARSSSGTVMLDGRPIGDFTGRELARIRSVLLQANQVSFGYTAHEVVEMGRTPWAGSGAARSIAGQTVTRSAAAEADDAQSDAAVVARALQRADVAHLATRAFASLSGGERARVSLARVLAQETPVVMLDEPTAALDLRHQEDVLRIARDLAAQGRAIVVVLHDLSLAAAYADDIAILDGGRLRAFGAPAEVLTEERLEQVYRTPVRVIEDPDTGRPVVLPRRGR
jgi:iron complex transport system ATP-binding protein